MAVSLNLDDIFRGRTVPRWLRTFERDPVPALHTLFRGGGGISPAEPSIMLSGWLEGIGDRFAAAVDEALAAWIQENWGRPNLPDASVKVSVVAWRYAFIVLGGDDRLVESFRTLRRLMTEEDRTFLANMRFGRSHDAESRAWIALARRQDDRSLVDYWWWLCKLPPELPIYYGDLGILGLRNLPEERPGSGGGFPHEAAEGVLTLADALVKRVEDGWLDENRAQEEFEDAAYRAMWAFNLEDKWLSFWRKTLPPADEEDSLVNGWVRQLFPEKLKQYRPQEKQRRRRHLEPNLEWLESIPDIRRRLGHPDDVAISDARSLLRDQQHYADVTGDSHFVVRTACNFAARVRSKRPDVALEWTQLARRYDPWNGFAWTTEASVLLELGRLADARRTAFEAVRRFPYDAVAYTTLAEVLAKQGRLADAEAVYREAVRRFQDDAVAMAGLGEVLRKQGRLADAEAVYREAVRRFQDDAIAPTGLGDVLCLLGRWDEAEEMYRTALARDPGHGHARTGLRKVERQGPLLDVAEDVNPYVSGDDEPDWQPVDVDIVLQDAFLLRHWARDLDPAERRTRARHLLQQLTRNAETNAAAAGELGLLALAEDDLDAALDLLRRAAERFAGSAKVRYALARVETEVARRTGEGNGVAHWRKLGKANAPLRLVQLLGEARAYSAKNGSGEQELRDCFGEIGWWVQRIFYNDAEKAERRKPTDAEPFNVAWARDLKTNLFGGDTVARAEDIKDLDALTANLAANASNLAFQEEIFVDHYSVS